MKNNRKLLIPLGTMLVAAAVTVGSGATWTSTTHNHVSITAGKIMHTNNHNNATLTVTRLKPGASESGTVTITEDATNNLDADLSLVVTNVSSGFTAGDLKIRIEGNGEDSGVVNFESLATDGTVDLGTLADGYGSEDVTITVSMPSSAGSQNQSKSASADLAFVTTTTSDPESGTTVTFP
ncbi:hypothetical protein ACT8ZV_13695 [Nocardioides sp. MAHUQ-72]|uniref:hypothetical protein n=1 Tax=unclassified Nocardioides TaxID=2615069 RepID=UPI00360652F2